MNSSRLSVPLAILVIVIAAVNGIANYWHLYHYIWWLDIPMHIAGGLWVGLATLVVARSRWNKGETLPAPLVVAVSVSGTIAIGLAWEWYELAIGRVVDGTFIGIVDTLKDLSDDLIGALLAAGFFLLNRYNK